MEQTKKDMAIIGLADALRFAKNELSAWEIARELFNGLKGDMDYARHAHGHLAVKLLEK